MKQTLQLLVLGLPLIGLLAAADEIALNEKEYFEGPGISFLLFHNNYMPGYQGGLQLIQNGERILDSGDLTLLNTQGQRVRHSVIRREVDRSAGTATIFGEIPEWNTGYRFLTRTDGKRLFVKLQLDKPLDWSKASLAGLGVSLYPTAYYSKSYQTENGSGVFTRHYAGRTTLIEGKKLRIAQEDPLYAVAFERNDGTLHLTDPRRQSVQAWFLLVAPFNRSTNAAELIITPTVKPDWRRKPVIGISQVGYHPRQPKRAVIELDAREEADGTARLFRLAMDGERVEKEGAIQPWGVFHKYRYGVFDFSEVREPGVYRIEYAGQQAGPFQISESVFTEAWQPTLRYFLPTQMCHVKVREESRIWHGACHLDDAQQAPADTPHLDGYNQTAERETKYADNEHIPGLDWGGWHDAGDHDIPAGSLCTTIDGLALAAEEFQPSLDLTTVSRKDREVILHRGDGVDDLLQQIAFGAEWLLATYKAAGHILAGAVERTGFQYGTKGDMMNTTDNLVYDPKLGEYEVKDGRSGKLDDRWVFTNRNTGLQYRTAKTLAISHRVLKKAMPELAAECLRVARELWQYEQENETVWGRSAYTPRDTGFRGYEMEATAELWLTTREEKYRRHVLSLVPEMEGAPADRFASGPGWTLARALPEISDERFRSAVRKQMAEWKKISDRRRAASPYGVLYPEEVSNPGYKLESRSHIHSGFVWGHGWNFQSAAMRHYYLHKHLPELFGPEVVLDTVNYVLGCHPATNESLVSSVGAYSTLAAYGFNRADWSHQPGGIISGTSLIKPDLLELKNPFPFLWYQTEIVIGGAGTWIFDVLAAEKLAKEMR